MCTHMDLDSFQEHLSQSAVRAANDAIHTRTMIATWKSGANGAHHVHDIMAPLIQKELRLAKTPILAFKQGTTPQGEILYMCGAGTDQVYGWCSTKKGDTTLTVYHRPQAKRPSYVVTKPVDMTSVCWLQEGDSPFDRTIQSDLFLHLAKYYLGAMDVLAMRMMSKKYARFGLNDAIWRMRTLLYETNVPAAMRLFPEATPFRKFVNYMLCFRYNHRRDPRKTFMRGTKPSGIASILCKPKYLPLLEFAFKKVDPSYAVRMVAPKGTVAEREDNLGPGPGGRTNRKRSRAVSAISCTREATHNLPDNPSEGVSSKKRRREILFNPVFAAGTFNGVWGNRNTMTPALWMTKGGKVFTAKIGNTRGQRRGGVEELCAPFLEVMDNL